MDQQRLENVVDFLCNVCDDVPLYPVLTLCGHVFCWECLRQWDASNPVCPLCLVKRASDDFIPLYENNLTSNYFDNFLSYYNEYEDVEKEYKELFNDIVKEGALADGFKLKDPGNNKNLQIKSHTAIFWIFLSVVFFSVALL